MELHLDAQTPNRGERREGREKRKEETNNRPISGRRDDEAARGRRGAREQGNSKELKRSRGGWREEGGKEEGMGEARQEAGGT